MVTGNFSYFSSPAITQVEMPFFVIFVVMMVSFIGYTFSRTFLIALNTPLYECFLSFMLIEPVDTVQQ